MSKRVSSSSFWFWTRFIIAMFFVAYTLLQANDVIAAVSKPSVLSVATGNTTELDNTVTKSVDVIAYIGYGIGAITFAIGIVLLSPLFGSRGEKGKTWMASGGAILVITGLIHFILALFSNLTS